MQNLNKQKRFCLQPISIACLMLFALASSNLFAAPLDLSQKPAGNSGKEPAPNVIISVDNSGSMNETVGGGDNTKKIDALKSALTAQFVTLDSTGNPKIPNNRIRLAWQSMWLNDGVAGSDSLTLGATNSMKRLDDAHRANFSTFVTSIKQGNATPSHKMMKNVYEYMKSPAGTNSPWANNPGVAQSTDYLACRRTYHVFMTDGAWNSEDNTVHNIGNQDGTAISALPTSHASLKIPASWPTAYTPFTDQTRIYSDTWGGETRTTQDCNRRGCTTKTQSYASTLADFAFRSWAEDLQLNMDNKISPLMRVTGNETVGNTTLQPFWNPKNNPATWQHITQHTIGFGTGATGWDGNPLWDSPNATTGNVGDNNYGGMGGYSALVNGTNGVAWQEPVIAANARESELWHMALNGRGKFYPARDSNALAKAFEDILDNILADTSKPLVSIAANGARLKAGLKAYVAGYDGAKWSGRLLAYPINATSGAVGTTATWSATGTGALDTNGKFIVNDPRKLDDPNYSVAGRFVASYDGTAGIEWKTYSSLPASHQLPLSKNSVGTVDHTTTNNYGQKRVDYIRGDRTNESSQTGGIFRNRESRLGDIVNSNILYVGKPNSGYAAADYLTFKGTASGGVGARAHMVYVGANDGMFHGFDAESGEEKLAYIPQGIAKGDLRKLTDTNYTHQYFVDGTPFISDAKVGSVAAGATWKTVLVSGLGGGGKGYFVLDVSNPNNFTAAKADALVIADTTFSNKDTANDADIGNMYITPAMDDFIATKSDQIVRLNAPESGTAPNKIKHRWALVLGNGYNSTNEAPVLIVQYLDGAREIKKISPCIAVSTDAFDASCAYKNSNGLSTPRLVDLNADGIADVAYAGDLNGNVWKFDLSSADDATWKTSFSNAPFFRAKTGQSFTTAPYVASNDAAGYGVVVNINSGKNLTADDQGSATQQTVYTLWDNSTFKNVAITPATTPVTYSLQITDTTPINTSSPSSNTTLNGLGLVQQTIDATPFSDKGFKYFTSSSNAVDYKGSTPKRGWYMDWEGVPGQRVLQNSKAFDGQKIQINSTKPSSVAGSAESESCDISVNGERSFLTVLNLFNGNPSKSVVYDLTSTVATSYPNTTTIEGNPAGDTIGLRTDEGIKFVPPCPEGTTCLPPTELKFGKYVGARANWREKK